MSASRWLRLTAFTLLVFLGALPTISSAITIALDGRHDNYFTTRPTALAALQAAADDLSAALTGSLNAINTDTYVGTNQSTTATFDWNYQYTNPTTGSQVTLNSATAPADTITLFYGGRAISGSTLGVGGPSGAGFGLNGTGFPNQWIGAVASAESQSENAYRRGGEGPVLGTLSGSSNFSGFVANYSIDYGPAYGNIWFDNDANWHFDHTIPVASGKSDFYSVALHEILHAIGVGSSTTWESLRSGTTWNGSEVIALLGSGSNVLEAGNDHFRQNLMSTRVFDGAPQEVVMDPNLTTGTRKYLTALDLAMLRDIGYQTVTVPDFLDGDFNSDGTVDAADYTVWRSGLGTTYDESDFRTWRSNYGSTSGSASSIAQVPEPGALGLFLLGIACSVIHRRSVSSAQY